MPSGEQIDTSIRLGKAFAENTLGMVASLACLAMVALFVFVVRAKNQSFDTLKGALTGAEARAASYKAELSNANEQLREMGERLAVLTQDVVNKTPDLKWLKRWVNARMREEEVAEAPKPKKAEGGG